MVGMRIDHWALSLDFVLDFFLKIENVFRLFINRKLLSERLYRHFRLCAN